MGEGKRGRVKEAELGKWEEMNDNPAIIKAHLTPRSSLDLG